MKRATTYWLDVVAALGMATGGLFGARADEVTVGGVAWSYSKGNDGAIVTGASPAKGEMVIPASLGGTPVVEIGYRAFSSCEEVTALTIPEGVLRIGDRAFQYCSGLENVSLPNGVTNIGSMAFQYCDSLSSIVLPQSMEGIGANVFFHCDALEKLYAPVAWDGTTKLADAGVGLECAVVYGVPGMETLVFDPVGGTCGITQSNYPVGVAYGWLPDASRNGYVFSGWWTTESGGVNVGETTLASTNEGWRKLYAHWTPRDQMVTFNANGGTCATESFSYPIGQTYYSLPDATRTNHAFEGWWTARNGGTLVTTSSEVTVALSLTLYAHWTLVSQVVTFNPNGGSCPSSALSYEVGGVYSSLPKASRAGFEFDGWFTELVGGDRISTASTVPAVETRTLYAHWTLTEQTVTFDANGGSCSTTSRVYAIGATYSPLPTATRAGYDFVGWYTALSGGDVIAETYEVTLSESRTLYAHWAPRSQKVTFNANGGVCGTTNQTYTVGKTYTPLPDATREHYAFAGWFTSAEGGSQIQESAEVTVAGSRTFHAHWTLVDQIVTFDPHGGSCDTSNRLYTVGGTYSPLPEATLDQYAFTGWYTEADGGECVSETDVVPATETRTLYAHWTLAKQVVTFVANGGDCDTSNRLYAVGGKYSPLPISVREGYEFDGWFTAATGGDRISGSSEVTAELSRTLYAHWTLVEQVVTFNPNGGQCDTPARVYTIGTTYGWLPEATRDGYTFGGWFGLGNEMPTEASSVVTMSRYRVLWAWWNNQGTMPTSVDDCRQATEDGGFTLRFTGTGGKTYALQRTPNLEGRTGWATVRKMAADRDGAFEMLAEMPGGWSKGFYRVLEATDAELSWPIYLVVDMSGGPEAEKWPIAMLDAPPQGGWTDEYKTAKLVLRRIDPGTFMMGSPSEELGGSSDERQHEVVLTEPYWIGVFEVTQRQWELAMGTRPSYFCNDDYYAMRPVEQVSYYDVRGTDVDSGWPVNNAVPDNCFLAVLREKTGLTFDLPTEAQWEYACRAGTTTALNSGKNLTSTDTCPNLAEVGRYWNNGGSSCNYNSLCSPSSGSATVGSYKPNAWGLYDMHGNVWEWCLDWYSGYPSGTVTNQLQAHPASAHVRRGGDWTHSAGYCRAATRYGYYPSYYGGDRRAHSLGLRLCCPAGVQ